MLLIVRVDESSAAIQKKNEQATSYGFDSVLLILSNRRSAQGSKGRNRQRRRPIGHCPGIGNWSVDEKEHGRAKKEPGATPPTNVSEGNLKDGGPRWNGSNLQETSGPCMASKTNGPSALRRRPTEDFILGDLVAIWTFMPSLGPKQSTKTKSGRAHSKASAVYVMMREAHRQTQTSLASYLKVLEGDSTHWDVIYEKYPTSSNAYI
uniref:Uncharacterized protein n=1 Tax=Glossina austeni TaxID=7395 RepID=A0A1A9VFK2_GLOAU